MAQCGAVRSQPAWAKWKNPKIRGCRTRISDYVAIMNWQQAVSLGIVGATAAILLWNKVRRRRFSLVRDTHCGCASVRQPAQQGSIIFRARKGERPQVLVKLR